MSHLANKNIVLGVTGGIAAYKTPELVRRLKEQGANVRVVLTRGGQAFVSELSLQAVSANTVSTELLDPTAEAAMGHIELAKWADIIMIAPATANNLAKLAVGIADDLLSTIVLATTAPIAVAPAMNQQMWAAPVVQHNLHTLRQRNVHILGPDSGSQACGDVGSGRMSDPLELVAAAAQILAPTPQILADKRVVITAGPTREPLDPVRYLSNRSSGKMGYALASAAAAAGASVTLVSGPTQLTAPTGVDRIDVTTATEMLEACQRVSANADIFIGCAAISDYRAATVATEKMKKSEDSETLSLTLVKNPDVIATIAKTYPQLFCVGFAAETQHLKDYAQRKLKDKNLQLIIANDVAGNKAFDQDQNSVTAYWQEGEKVFPEQPKRQLADDLIALISQLFNHAN